MRVSHIPDPTTGSPLVQVPSNWHWHGEPLAGREAVVFDIDGVLSDAAGRQHFLASDRRDWEAFFQACGDDPVVDELAILLGLLDGELAVVLLTGRPLRVRPQTLAWLERYSIRYDLLVMREHGDSVRVSQYKRSSVRALRAYGFELLLAFEDDPKNRDMFHAEGVPCVYIHSGYYG